MVMSNTAVILAGGVGSRLYPYTVSLPKPLLPVGGKPILEIILTQLQKFGFKEVILAVNHQANIIMSYFGNGEKYRLNITYSLETKPLSTMAPLKMLDDLPDNFLVMNGDVLTDLDYKDFFEQHVFSNADFSVSTYKVQHKSQFGVLSVDKENVIVGFEEKPTQDLLVSMGIYAMNRQSLALIPENIIFGFDDFMYRGLEGNISLQAINHNGYWRDLGTPEDYQKANDDIEREGFVRFL